LQGIAVALIRWVAGAYAFPAHHRRYPHDRTVEPLSVKSVCLDNYLLSDRHFIYITFVYLSLNVSRGSIRQTEQWTGSKCAKRLAASGIDPKNVSVDRPENRVL